MIVGVLTRTGAALAFGGVVVQAAQGILIVAMVLIFLVVSVLGTGIPTTAAYVIAVTVGAAAMGNLGVSLLAAHLFVFYYAVLSDLTPPDAVTAFAAANIAGSDMFGTGIEAFRLGIAGFLVPFAFVFHPELLLKGDWAEILLMTGFAAVSATALASVVVGHGWAPIGLGPARGLPRVGGDAGDAPDFRCSWQAWPSTRRCSRGGCGADGARGRPSPPPEPLEQPRRRRAGTRSGRGRRAPPTPSPGPPGGAARPSIVPRIELDAYPLVRILPVHLGHALAGGEGDAELLADLSRQRALGRLARLGLPAGKLPQPLEVRRRWAGA